MVTYAQEVSDPVSGFVKMKVSYGSCQIVKTSEDGKVDGIQFTISGNGVNQTVTTANGGKFQLDNLMPGVYTVTEQSIDKICTAGGSQSYCCCRSGGKGQLQ